MNPVLVLIIILVTIALWFLLSFVFYPLGKMVYRIYKEAIDEMNRKDKFDKEEENIKNEK